MLTMLREFRHLGNIIHGHRQGHFSEETCRSAEGGIWRKDAKEGRGRGGVYRRMENGDQLIIV